jgi:hypothetical protein
MNDGMQSASARPGPSGPGAGPSQASTPPAAVALPGVRQFGARPSGRARRASAGGAEWRGLSRPGLGSPVAARPYVRSAQQSTGNRRMSDFDRTATDQGEQVNHPARTKPPLLILGALAATMAFVILALAATASAAPPAVYLAPVTDHSITTAQVSGEVSVDSEADGGFETYWCFEASPEGQEAWIQGTCAGAGVPPGTTEEISGQLTGLNAEQTYEARISYFNFNDFITEYSKPRRLFTTGPAPNAPTFVLGPAENVSYTTAHISGSFNPEGGNEDAVAGPIPITAQLEVNREGQGWNPVGNPLTVEGADAVSSEEFELEADPTELAAGAEYRYRVAARYAGVLATSGEGEFTTLAVTPPSAEDLEVTNVTTSSAHFGATVKTNAPGGLDAAGEAAYKLHWSFSPGGSSGETEAETGSETVSGDATGLEPHHSYTATITVSNAGGSSEISVPFETGSAGIDISRETLWEPTETSIQLNANVNAHNSELTDCHLEYGTTTAYGHSAPCQSPLIDGAYEAPADNADHTLSARISGLAPSTEYHFRLVAANDASGEVSGDDRSFTSLEEPTPESCSNQARRDEQHSSQLPDCRAYEMVSPLAKGQGDIVGDGETTVAATDGNGVVFNSRNQFADAVGSAVSGQTTYLARRGESGWSTHSITPMPRPDALQTFFGATKVQVFSDDLSRAILWGYDLPAVTEEEPNRINIYGEDTASHSLQSLTVSRKEPRDVLSPFEFLNERALGVSADARHFAFTSPARLVQQPAIPVGGRPKLYQSDNGALSLAGILPDGTVPAGGAAVFPRNYKHAMSSDGSRLAFTSPVNFGATPEETSQLYLRIDGDRTVWVSEPEGSEQSTPRNVFLQAMSPDGHTVLFVSDSRLLDEDHNTGPDLYRWIDGPDPAYESNLTLISHSGDVPEDFAFGGTVVGLADDGQRIYYHTLGSKIVLWEPQETRVITSAVSREGTAGRRLTAADSNPGLGRVAPDGNYLSLVVADAPDNVHGITGRRTFAHFAAYLYDRRNDTLRCVSCTSAGVRNDSSVLPEVTLGNPTVHNIGDRPHFLADDGHLYFSTADSLLPGDVNGVRDAYSYDPRTGDLSLLSTGQGSDPAGWAAASDNGDDAFIATRQPLVAGDTDNLVDLYDARVGGGFPEPPPSAAPCAGEGCQGASSPPPAAPSVASAATSRGNLKQRRHSRRCTRPKHRAGKCRAHKHRKHAAGHHRAANANRRVSK